MLVTVVALRPLVTLPVRLRAGSVTVAVTPLLLLPLSTASLFVAVAFATSTTTGLLLDSTLTGHVVRTLAIRTLLSRSRSTLLGVTSLDRMASSLAVSTDGGR